MACGVLLPLWEWAKPLHINEVGRYLSLDMKGQKPELAYPKCLPHHLPKASSPTQLKLPSIRVPNEPDTMRTHLNWDWALEPSGSPSVAPGPAASSSRI